MYPSNETNIADLVARWRPDECSGTASERHVSLLIRCCDFINIDLRGLSLDDTADRIVATSLLTKFIEELEA